MKKHKRLILIMLAALAAILAVSVFGFGVKNTKAQSLDEAQPRGLYTYYFESYSLTYDVAPNRKIAVTEDISVHFTGTESTGLKRYIPVNGGEQVKNISVCEIAGGESVSVFYKVSIEDSDFITVDIGDYSNKTDKICNYRIKYDYCLARIQEGRNKLKLNVIGVDRDCVINDASVTVILPKGYKGAQCYKGRLASSAGEAFTTTKDGDKTVLFFTDSLAPYEGVTFDISFEKGSLSSYISFAPYLAVLVAAVMLTAVVIVKLLVFNKNKVMPVVNYDAPDDMDPLMMGKLIDNVVGNEDVTSLLYYWADKGYIKINLDNKDDPVLIRIWQTLPEGTPRYQRTMYDELFKKGDSVRVSSLKYKFYNTVNTVKGQVNKQTKNLYIKKSFVLSILAALLSGLACAVTPVILGMATVSARLISLRPVITILPVLAATAISYLSVFYSQKLKKSVIYLMRVGIGAVAAFIVYMLLPSYAMDIASRILLAVICAAAGVISSTFITRSDDYTRKLNDIVGFKNFILLAEKAQLETMLESDPQFYYHILPYAQVLGVSDKWEKKFADLTVEPPKWLAGDMLHSYIGFAVLNSAINNSMRNMATNLASRPSSSGRSGSGGFGGGHVGGGHGGGGFGGR